MQDVLYQTNIFIQITVTKLPNKYFLSDNATHHSF